MANATKREAALLNLIQTLDDVLDENGPGSMSGLRMNIWTIQWLYEDSIHNFPVRPAGDPDWPLGACCDLGPPYDLFVFVDNTLNDGEWKIDYK